MEIANNPQTTINVLSRLFEHKYGILMFDTLRVGLCAVSLAFRTRSNDRTLNYYELWV